MIDKIVADGKDINLSEDLFELSPGDINETEAITRPSLTFWQDARKRLFKNKGAMFGLTMIVIIVLMPILSSLGVMDGSDVYKDKNIEENYWFGTDYLGRDIWTRVWTGARVSLYIALIAALFDLVIGVTYGGISAYYGGKVDIIMQRIIEIITGIPSLVILTLFIMVLEPGILSMSLAMAVSGWTGMARVVRSHVLRLKNQEFVLASKTLGSSDFKLILKHLIPNIIGQIVVMIMFTLPSAIFYEAFLSFIGLGLQPPQASLGVLINDGFKSFQTHPYTMFIPALVICLLIFSLNLLADGLRDAVDPKMRNQ